MARYERGYTGEKQTEFIGLHVTPSLCAKLKADAEASGAASFNAYLNELLENRQPRRAVGMKRNPDAAALIRELHAIGINYNQLAKYRHSTGERERQAGEADEVETLLKQAFRRVIELVEL